MGRFFYTHFGDDVPQHIEKEYNKLRRQEMWLEEKEADFRAFSVDYKEIETVLADPSTLPVNEIAAEKEAMFQARLDFLPIAMEMLKAEFPEGYELIKDYFYGTSKVTLMYLASKYGITKDKVRYQLRLAKEKLKEYIIMHENK